METLNELVIESPTATKAATFDRTGVISALGKKYGVVLLTVFALVLRLTNLDVSYWYDEGFTGHLSRLAPGAILDFLAREDVHPPLYFLLARFWAEAFPNDIGLRYFSVIFGTLCIPVFFSLCRKLFDFQIALVAGAFLTVSAFHIQYSQEARPYALYMFLTTAALWFLVTAIQSERNWNGWWLAYSLTTALILYTQGVGILILLGIGAFYFCLTGFGNRTRLLPWIIYTALGVLLFLPWLPTLFQQSGRADVHTWLPPVSLKNTLSTMEWYLYAPPVGNPGRMIHIIWLGPHIFLLCAALFCIKYVSGKKIAALISLIFVPVVVITIYGYLRQPVFVGRMLAPVIFPLLILTALPVIAFQKNRLRHLFEILTITALVFSFIGSMIYLRGRQGADWRGAAGYIQKHIQPEDALILMPEKSKYVFGYYFQNAGEQQNIISVTKIGDLDALAPDLSKGYQRIWVVRDKVVSSGETEETLARLEERNTIQSVEGFSSVEIVVINTGFENVNADLHRQIPSDR